MTEAGESTARDRIIELLYIDDDEVLCVLVRDNLERRGYRVHIAPDVDSGLAFLDRSGIDAVAIDHHIGGKAGFDMLRRILARDDPPPVVYLTRWGDTGVAVAALKMGAIDYVIKSVSPDYVDLLDAALGRALERVRYRRETERAKEVIRQERDRAELLLAEVNHRVANSLGLVAALVRMQASLTKDKSAVDALNETQMRINAIGSVHRRLYTSKQIGQVQIEDYLSSLLEELEDSMRDERRPHSVRAFCEAITLPTDKAVTLGLIVSELVTNAFKYAYPDGGSGEIRVSVEQCDPGRLKVTVEDDGVGFVNGRPAQGTGLGTRIMAAMASSLMTEIVYDPCYTGGTRALLVFSMH